MFAFAAVSSRAGELEEKDGKLIIHLKLAWLPDPTLNSPKERGEVKVVKEFIKRFPEIFRKRWSTRYKADPAKYGKFNWDNVEIRLHRFSGITLSGNAGNSGPLMAIAGGVSPDIIYVNFAQSDTYIQQGFLYPLNRPEDNYFSALTKEEVNYRIHSKIMPVVDRVRHCTKEKSLWMVPYGGILVKVFLYRKDLLRKAGVPFPNNDWTWNDFLNSCRTVCNSVKGAYGFSLARGLPEAWRFNDFVWSAGGDIIKFDKNTGQWKAAFDSPAAVEALRFYTELGAKPWRDKWGSKRWGYTYKEAGDQFTLWAQGRIAFLSTYLDGKTFSTLDPDQVGIINVPKAPGPNGYSSGQINSRMFGIFAGVKNMVVRDAAWEYLRFVSSKEADRIRTEVLVNGGVGHFVNPSYLKMFGYDDLLRLSPKGWHKTFEIALENGQPEPYGKNCQVVYEYILKPIQKAMELTATGKIPTAQPAKDNALREILAEGVKNTNEVMLDQVPPDEMRFRRIVACIAILIIAMSFAMVFRMVFKAFSPAGEQAQKGKWQFRRYKWAYIILIPAVTTILFWSYLPLILGSRMAFMDYNIMGNSKMVWADNFANLLWNKYWWETVWNSFQYSILVISLTFLPPVILAVILQEIPKGKLLFRTIFYLPHVISGLVIVFLWKSFYQPNEYGVLNKIVMGIPMLLYLFIGLGIAYVFYLFAKRLWIHECRRISALCIFLGVSTLVFMINICWPVMFREGVPFYKGIFATLDEPVRWLENPSTAMLSCVIPMVWAGMGPGCLIYLAALKGLADDFYEAADIDGATFIDKIMFIVLPLLKPLLIIQFVGIFISAWKNEAYILAMTGGSSGTEVAGLHIFYKAYTHLKFGPATAMAWVLGFILIGFTVHQLRILAKIEFRTTGDK